MILREGKQHEEPKGLSLDEHLHYGNIVVVKREVSSLLMM